MSYSQFEETSLSLDWPTRYWRQPSKESQQNVILLLHGYQQTGAGIFRKLSSLAEKNTTILSVNGLFPVPVRLGDGHGLGAAWYFFDPETRKYFVEMKPAVDYLMRFCRELQLLDHPMAVIGFSQGGYLAPFFAKENPLCRQVIGLGSRWRSEKLDEQYHFRYDAIHGTKDLYVDHDQSKNCHEQLLAKGNHGHFISVKELGHQITDEVVKHCRELLSLGLYQTSPR